MAESSSKSYLKTVSLCCSFWAVGMVYNIFGPTILELQCSLDLTYDEVIRIIPARASGYAIGSLLVGLLHKHLNPIFTITVTMATMGTCAIFIPWAKSLTAVLALTFMGTMGGGMIDNTSNVLMLYMWGKESQPYMQALHFCFGFGSLVAPLLASPFLSAGEAPIEGVASNVTNIGALCIKEDLRFYISYAIIGTFCLCVSAVFLYMTCFARQTEEHPSRLEKKDGALNADKDSIWSKNLVIFVAALFLFNILGLEIGMGTFITSFAVLGDLHLTKQVGAYMTSLYWFAYTFFRLLAIAFIDKIGIRQTIVLDLGILVVANIFLVPFANSVEWCLWVGIVLAGIGLSTIWASTYSLLESHFPVTSGAASFLCVSVCLGEWVYPVIMGYAFDDSAQLYLWFIFGCTVLCFLLFIMLCIALRAMVTGAQTPLKSTLANYGSVIIETGLKPERDADTRKISAAESNA